ncbi:hypothetical protein [Fibrella forsythiae]|uniref:hypothetical protein n=1 Tax=Fibrella forsythiae TaxID=2817061 RepID=UPI001E5A7984|nr:hypothetical protein [Fibrella forsythiae]
MQAELSFQQIEQFIQDGFVRIDDAFPAEVAQAARTIPPIISTGESTLFREDEPC